MMRSRVVLVDLPEDGRRVINHSRLPRKQPSWPACYNPTKSKFCSRKNANCRVDIFRSSEPCRTGIEVMGCQFLANLGRTRLYVVQAVIAHAEDLLCCPQPRPTKARIAHGGLMPHASEPVPSRLWPGGQIMPPGRRACNRKLEQRTASFEDVRS